MLVGRLRTRKVRIFRRLDHVVSMKQKGLMRLWANWLIVRRLWDSSSSIPWRCRSWVRLILTVIILIILSSLIRRIRMLFTVTAGIAKIIRRIICLLVGSKISMYCKIITNRIRINSSNNNHTLTSHCWVLIQDNNYF